MSEEDYKSVIASYQQRSFDLFNANVMLETQVAQLKKQNEELQAKLLQDQNNGPDDF
jgi:hypothetical protein